MSGAVQEHPMQPIALDDVGTPRFKGNRIVRWLVEQGLLDLNAIGALDFPAEDRQQLTQLLGYSVSGYGDLSYVTAESVAAADEIAAKLVKAGNGGAS